MGPIVPRFLDWWRNRDFAMTVEVAMTVEECQGDFADFSRRMEAKSHNYKKEQITKH